MFEADFTGFVCERCGIEINEEDRYFKDVCNGAGIEGYEILCLECFEKEEGE